MAMTTLRSIVKTWTNRAVGAARREGAGMWAGWLPLGAGRPIAIDQLEARQQLNAAFDLIGLSEMRNDPTYAGLDGTGIAVAVLDTGVDRTHVNIAPNYIGGRNITDGGDNPVDRQAHGTHVAGIVAASNAQIGAAPDAKLVGVKVLGDNGSGTFTDIRDGLRWVYDNRTTLNIKVVNMSLGGGFFTNISQTAGDILLTEVRRLESAGITVVSAGGNSFKNNEYQNFGAPGIYSTLVVGATWQDGTNRNISWGSGATDFTTGAGRITSFSQRLVASNTIFAPGAFIRSTVPGNRFESMGGTSQASPLVAGCVAILQEAAQRFGGRFLSPSEVREVLISTSATIFDGDDEDDNVRNTQVNYPRIDIYSAVREVRTRLLGTAPTPTPDPGGGTNAADGNGTLAGAFLMNPSLDGSESLSAAGRIGVDFGTTQVGPTDVDMFKITTATRGTVTMRVASNATTPEDFDTFLRLFNESGTQLAVDDNSGGGGFSQISLVLDAGTYYVGLSGKGNDTYDPANAGSGATARVNGATGAYSVTFTLANSDPNGLFAGAVAVNFGTDEAPTSFAGLIGRDYGEPVGTSDVDMFKVVAPDSGVLTVDTDTPDDSGFVDSYLRIFDEAGNEIAFDDDSVADDETREGSFVLDSATGLRVGHFTDSFKTIAVQRGRTYYVAISDFDNQSYNPGTLEGRVRTGTGGTYDIYLKFSSVDADGTLALARSQAALVFPFAGVAGTIGADTVSGVQTDVGDKDVDFYRLRFARASLLQLSADATSNGSDGESLFDSALFLFDSSGNLLAFNDDFTGVNPVLQFIVNPNVDYYVAVAGFGNDSFDPAAGGSGSAGDTGTYVLSGTLFQTSAVKTISDDANGFALIQQLAPGSSVRGVLSVDRGFNSGAADVDLYKFVAPSDGVLTVNADGFEEFSADTFVRLFDSGGRELTFNDNRSNDTRGSTASIAVKRGKTYVVGVNGAGDSARSYDPRRFGTARPGSTGSYQVDVSFNAPPTLTSVLPLEVADAGRPFVITYDMLAAAANESDPEGGTVSFALGRVSGGTLTKNGGGVTTNVTLLSPGESWVWTPANNANNVTRAFTVQAFDGVQKSARAVQVSVRVNSAPTLTSVREVRLAGGATEVVLDYATLLNAANENDRNRDGISFRIEAVLAGSLTLNGEEVVPGVTLVTPGSSLLYRAPQGALGRVGAFSLVAFDGRLFSANPVTVNARLT
jgi:hypothetical protein